MNNSPRANWAVCIIFLLSALHLAHPVSAESRSFALYAPPALVESGFLKFLLPRFSLKTGIRIKLTDDSDSADASFGTDNGGVPAFTGLGEVWSFNAGEGASTDRFQTWLSSKVGRRTIDSFKKNGSAPFVAADGKKVVEVVAEPMGDIVLGEKLSVQHCGRCHMVNEQTRLTTIGSTPSFALIRALPEWRERFEGFYALNPHPAFTIVEGVTAERDETLPIHIQPLKLSLDHLDAMTAYILTIKPKDLGKPLSLK